MLLSFFLLFFDVNLFAFHEFVINMGISGDCVTDRLNTNLFARHKKKRQKKKTPNQFLFKCCFQHSQHIACFLCFDCHTNLSYHISYSHCISPQECIHTVEYTSVCIWFVYLLSCVCVLFISLILAFKVYCI